MLSQEEKVRYNRQIILNDVGEQGQLKLRSAKVLVIGAGGLGSPVLQIVAAAGVGTIGVMDGDRADVSNLHRQLLFSEDDIGKLKSEAAVERLKRINSNSIFISYPVALMPDDALELISNYDLIIDGSDNFATRYLVNDACVKLDKPFVSGSVFKYQGQVGVFNYKDSGTYRCLFPEPPRPEEMPDCDEIGVLGSVTGVVGALMANETLKVILNIGDILTNRLLVWYALSLSYSMFSYKRQENEVNRVKSSPLPSYEEYAAFCHTSNQSQRIKEISSTELKKKLGDHENVFLIDVREPYEHEDYNIGGELIPLSELEIEIEKIPKEEQVIFYCKVGTRSRFAVQMLQEKYGFKNLVSLAGGIDSYLLE
jgi:sulfur-carrier protein adenylyltransferase/sulfurtransferase